MLLSLFCFGSSTGKSGPGSGLLQMKNIAKIILPIAFAFGAGKVQSQDICEMDYNSNGQITQVVRASPDHYDKTSYAYDSSGIHSESIVSYNYPHGSVCAVWKGHETNDGKRKELYFLDRNCDDTIDEAKLSVVDKNGLVKSEDITEIFKNENMTKYLKE